MDWLFTGFGLVILLLAGDALVKGAVNLSLRIGIPALIVSLTIVAFGTSAPELLISITAGLEGVPGIALGNVVGSNTANILLVLGVPALLATMHSAECDTRKSYVMMMMGSVLFVALAFTGPFTAAKGMVLLAALSFVLFDAVRDARAHRAAGQELDLEEPEGADPDMPWKNTMRQWSVLRGLSRLIPEINLHGTIGHFRFADWEITETLYHTVTKLSK